MKRKTVKWEEELLVGRIGRTMKRAMRWASRAGVTKGLKQRVNRRERRVSKQKLSMSL